jgi:DNA-binding response OmpR family regulator
MSTPDTLVDVLVVEDDPAQTQGCTDVLTAHGYRVVTVTGVADALAQLEARRPHLVLLDLSLPDGSGWELVAAIRASPATRDLPIVVLSARDLPGEAAEPTVDRVQSYLSKPCDPIHLEAVIRGVLLRRGVRPPGPTRPAG